jgi:histidine triad (HIT) family protein
MNEQCLFCRIIAREIPSDTVYEDDDVYAFKDINPQAPVHILIIPKIHINSVNELDESQYDLIGHMTSVARKIAENENLTGKGYRLVINCGPDGGQVVAHLHLHLIGGKKLTGKIG